MRIVQLSGFGSFTSSIDRSIGAPKMGESGGIGISIKHLRYSNSWRSASSDRPITSTDGRPEAIGDDVRSYCRSKAEVFVRRDTLSMSIC